MQRVRTAVAAAGLWTALLGACAGAPPPAASSSRPSSASSTATGLAAVPEPDAEVLGLLSDAAAPVAERARAAVPARAAAPPAAAQPMFAATVTGIDAALAERMAASWRAGCPVPLSDLRYVTVSHVDFDGAVRTGEVVVHADVADGLVEVFATLFAARFPIRQMRLVDDFGADDTASMEADNTSAFNCRAITGGTQWSEHAYGRAIDVNPLENPYVRGDHVAPRAARAYLHRPDAPGVIRADDVVVRAFTDAGWRWGGYWDRPVDYQHFSTTGR